MSEIITQKTKVSSARLRLAASNASAVLAKASPYEFQPGSRQLLPMLAELKEMRRHLAEDWPKYNLHDLNLSVRFGDCTQAEADRDQAELCRPRRRPSRRRSSCHSGRGRPPAARGRRSAR